MSNDDFKQAVSLAEKAASWQQVRQQLKKEKLEINPENMQELINFWHNKEAEKLTDKQLTDELEYWANGGSYKTHLRGYNAIKPAVLIKNAGNRNWFVKKLKNGEFIINPPNSLPLSLKKIF